MNEDNKTALIIVFVIVLILLVLLGGATMSGAMLSGGMMGNGTWIGINWMWMPNLLLILILGMLIWIIFSKKK